MILKGSFLSNSAAVQTGLRTIAGSQPGWILSSSHRLCNVTYPRSIRSGSPLDSLPDPVDDLLFDFLLISRFKCVTARFGFTALMIAFPIRLKLGRLLSFDGEPPTESDALLDVRASWTPGCVKSPDERLFFDLKSDFRSPLILRRNLDFFEVLGLFSPSLVPSACPLTAPITVSCSPFSLIHILSFGAVSALIGVPRGFAYNSRSGW